MAKAKRMSKRRDIGVFKRTYNKTKKINHSSGAQQGGIRL